MNLPDLEQLATDWRSEPTGDPAVVEPMADAIDALVARVRELDGMTKAGAYWEERAQEHRMRVRELEAEVAQLKVDLNEARGADVESIERIADMVKNPPEANAALRSLLARRTP